MDAWFDVTTARYRDIDQSLWFLVLEVPLALAMFWIARRIYKRLTFETPLEETAARSTLARGWGTHDVL
jgi:hypothetical protein